MAIEPPKLTYEFKSRQPGQGFPGVELDIQIAELVSAWHRLEAVLNKALTGELPLKPGSVGRIALAPGIFSDVVKAIEDKTDANVEKTDGAVDRSEQLLGQIEAMVRSAAAVLTAADKARAETIRAKNDTHAQKRFAQQSVDQAISQLAQAANDANTATQAANSALRAEHMAFRWAEYLAGPVIPANGDVDAQYSAHWWATEAQRLVSNIGNAPRYLGLIGFNDPDPPTPPSDESHFYTFKDSGTRTTGDYQGPVVTGDAYYYQAPALGGTEWQRLEAFGTILPAANVTYVPDANSGTDETNVQDALTEVGNLAFGKAETFLQLTDTPGDYTGQVNQFVAVNASADGLEFRPATAGSTFVGLFDTPANYTGQDGKVLTVDETGNAVIFSDPPDYTFTALTDTPADYTGQNGKFVAVTSGEDGVEFVDAPDPVSTFTGLTDTPGDYTGEQGKAAVVNATETGLEFQEISVDLTNYAQKNVAETITASWTFSEQITVRELGGQTNPGIAFGTTGTGLYSSGDNVLRVAVANVFAAQFDPTGTGTLAAETVMTREKADARYGRLTGGNTWTSDNDFQSRVVVATDASATQILAGYGSGRNDAHVGIYTQTSTLRGWVGTAGSDMRLYCQGTGDSLILNNVNNINALQFNDTSVALQTVIHTGNLTNQRIARYETSSSASLTNYAIGTTVILFTQSRLYNHNQAITVRNLSGNQAFTDYSGTTLSGTWRSRGRTEVDGNNRRYLAQRVA